MNRRWISALLLAGLLLAPVGAEQVYLRNKPFKGTVSGKGAATMVELPALASGLGLKVTPVNGGWCVNAGEPSGQNLAGPGKVIVEGKEVEARLAGDQVQVNLKQAAEAAGARFAINSSMDTIDVNMPTKPIVAAAGTPPTAPVESGPKKPLAPITVKQKTPGEKLLVSKWLQPGRTNIVYFHADW